MSIRVGRHTISDDEKVAVLVRLEREADADALDPDRLICQASNGRLFFCEVTGAGAAQVGPTFTLAEAQAAAMAVLVGDAQVSTHPQTLRLLAAALIASGAERARGRAAGPLRRAA